jgi:hypothetical protein
VSYFVGRFLLVRCACACSILFIRNTETQCVVCCAVFVPGHSYFSRAILAPFGPSDHRSRSFIAQQIMKCSARAHKCFNRRLRQRCSCHSECKVLFNKRCSRHSRPSSRGSSSAVGYVCGTNSTCQGSQVPATTGAHSITLVLANVSCVATDTPPAIGPTVADGQSVHEAKQLERMNEWRGGVPYPYLLCVLMFFVIICWQSHESQEPKRRHDGMRIHPV